MINTDLDPTELSLATGIDRVAYSSASYFDHSSSTKQPPSKPLITEPETIEEVSRLLAWANKRGLKVVILGSGTKIGRGNDPTACHIILSMTRISGIIEHAAGDMTASVRAGTPFSDLQSQLALSGQFLALDPPYTGTIGGLIATGDSGPRRLHYGGVRDMLLGVTFVRADGTIARGGGKVVKNVAGYDLPKLLTGSLGTLGVIVEATFRLYPIPPSSATIVSTNIMPNEAAKAAARILASGLTPSILDYSCHDGQPGIFAARFESSPLSVEGQSERALSLLDGSRYLSEAEEAAIWAEFDRVAQTNQGDVLARLIAKQSDLPYLLEHAQQHAEQENIAFSLRAHLGHGHAILRLHNPANEAAISFLKTIRAEAGTLQGNLVLWRAPATLQSQMDPWGDPGEGLPLMRKVKQQFDPNNTLNPGRFVGGI